MDEKSLRKLIREEVESVLDEADKAKKEPPQTFEEFRKQLASALKKAKAPPGLTAEVADIGNEGGMAGVIWQAWDSIRSDLDDARKGRDSGDVDQAWKAGIEFYVHDLVIDMVSEFSNPMNYAPGSKKGQKRADGPSLASAVVAALLNKEVGAKKNALLDVANLVIDVLEGSRAASDVMWDGKSDKVTYGVTRSDYLERIFDVAEKAGFEPDYDNDDMSTYHDSTTGATIKFGDGVATISFK